MADLSEGIGILPFNHNKHSYIHYHNALAGWFLLTSGLLPIKSLDLLITLSSEITWQTKTIKLNHYISTTRIAIATKLWRMVTCFDGFLPKKLHDRFFTWSCEFAWQTKTVISPLSQCLWPPNLVGWWFILQGSKL